MANLPKNAQAIKNWIEKNRPDMAHQIDALMENDAMILLLTIGFEAGRNFQFENPTLEINRPSVYLS